MAVAAAVDGLLVNQPPASPVAGACYIVGAAPQGAWTGHSQNLAGYDDGGWRFLEPIEGMSVLDKAGGFFATFLDGAWETGSLRGEHVILDGAQVVGPRLAAVPDPTGGSVLDAEARSAIAVILSRLRQHGLIEP